MSDTKKQKALIDEAVRIATLHSLKRGAKSDAEAVRNYREAERVIRAALPTLAAIGSVISEEPEWEWGSEGADGTEDSDPRPLWEDKSCWPQSIHIGVKEPNAAQAAEIVAYWNKAEPGSARLVRRRKAGPWVAGQEERTTDE